MSNQNDAVTVTIYFKEPYRVPDTFNGSPVQREQYQLEVTMSQQSRDNLVTLWVGAKHYCVCTLTDNSKLMLRLPDILYIR